LTANETAIILSLEPVFASLYAAIIVGEILGIHGWLGGFLVVIGVIYGQTGKK
jgi:drug/metabolite transporter (DMT)-like permease